MFTNFYYLLRDYGVPATMQSVLELHQGMDKGLASNLEELFILMRLCFVKRVEHMDSFERAFALYFYNIDIPAVAEDDPELLRTKQFREWLRDAIDRGDIKPVTDNLSTEEIMRRFWETLRQQMEAHHGGNRWVGTGGSSPFGHSGQPRPGMRVMGKSMNRQAFKVIGERRYVDYSGRNTLKGSNIRQALGDLKHLKPAGARTGLDVDETVYRSGRNGGEIELVFRRELRDKIEVVLLLDNGGTSMTPFVEITTTLFAKARDRFRDLATYYFHNTIYEKVYRDPRHSRGLSTHTLLGRKPETRLIIVGDASMAPDELLSRFGNINYGSEDYETSMSWLQRLRERFAHSIWLNPIPRERWDHGAWTLRKIREVFPMEDLTLEGVKRAVTYLNKERD